MGRIVQPGSSRYDGDFGRSRGGLVSFFASFVRLVREYGLRGIMALVVAAVFAFAPAAVLVWFNTARFASVVQLKPNQTVIVKPARLQEDQEKDEPGETAMLTVSCEIPSVDGRRPLLIDGDPARDAYDFSGSQYVRREQVYVRPIADVELPSGLLGRPPVSAWLPPGDYEVLVVHEAPSSKAYVDAARRGFPFVTVRETCTLEDRKKTECRIFLPHYDWSAVEALLGYDAEGQTTERSPTADELRPILAACEAATAVPTPGGYLLTLPEPFVHHADDHRGCAEDYARLTPVTREWTREQLATVRNWLPDDATAARSRLTKLVDALGWREFFQGWYCYAAAGVAGLIFTRWGATAMLEPWQRRQTFAESVKLMFSVFCLSAVIWIAVQVFLG